MSPTKASTTIPLLYRFLINNVEPLLALSGSALLLISPGTYHSSLTRGPGASTYDSSQQWIHTQLAGAWLVIVFLEGVILRVVDDLRVWRLACMAVLLSDALYTHALAQAVGGWVEWLQVANWTTDDWTALVTTWPFVLTRIAIVLGIGIGSGNGSRKTR